MVKITKYTQAILLAMMGIYMVSATNGILFSIIGGMFVGSSLIMARKSGEENC